MFEPIKNALRAKRGSRQLESRRAHPASLLVVVIVGLLGYKEVPYSGILCLLMLSLGIPLKKIW